MKIRTPDDLHVHFRSGEMLRSVVSHTAKVFGRALVMPNLTPPITTAEDVVRYRDEIHRAAEGFDFTPLMTIKLGKQTTPAVIKATKRVGAVAAKFYPEGATTNAEGGYPTLTPFYPIFSAMQDEGLVLCLHGERPDAFTLDRESAFLSDLHEVMDAFPSLKIVLEHVTTRDAVEFVRSASRNVAATITPHHLLLTLDDIIGGSLNPHAFCKPVAKRPDDRDALIEAAISGNPKFFFGSDTAPHTKTRKECAGCAGIFCAPTALETLAEVFDREKALDKLEGFVSSFGANFYGLPWNQGKVEIVREEWECPALMDEVVPFRAGERLSFKARPV